MRIGVHSSSRRRMDLRRRVTPPYPQGRTRRPREGLASRRELVSAFVDGLNNILRYGVGALRDAVDILRDRVGPLEDRIRRRLSGRRSQNRIGRGLLFIGRWRRSLIVRDRSLISAGSGGSLGPAASLADRESEKFRPFHFDRPESHRTQNRSELLP